MKGICTLLATHGSTVACGYNHRGDVILLVTSPSNNCLMVARAFPGFVSTVLWLLLFTYEVVFLLLDFDNTSALSSRGRCWFSRSCNVLYCMLFSSLVASDAIDANTNTTTTYDGMQWSLQAILLSSNHRNADWNAWTLCCQLHMSKCIRVLGP